MDSSAKNYNCEFKAATKPFTFRCEIEHFFLQIRGDNGQYDSPDFEVGDGVPMRLCFRPEHYAGESKLAVYLRPLSEQTSTAVDFSITIVNNAQPEKSITRKIFGKGSHMVRLATAPYSVGIMFRLSELIKEGAGFLKDNHLLTVLVEGVAFIGRAGSVMTKLPFRPLEMALRDEVGGDFGRMFNEGAFSDLVLKAKDPANGTVKEFKVHKMVLSARSKVFAAMLSNPEVKESLEVEEDVDSGAMEALLRFLYTGKIVVPPPAAGSEAVKEGNNSNNVDRQLELLIAADKYGIDKLKDHLERVLASPPFVDRVCRCLAVAERHSAPLLAACCREFIREKMAEVAETDGWAQLCAPENAKLIGSIISGGGEDGKK